MTAFPSPAGELVLGHVLEAAGLEIDDVLVIRHTYTPSGIASPAEATPENLLAYTKRQDVRATVFPRQPAGLWLTFMADGGGRSRFLTAYENRGEVEDLRTAKNRNFDLHQSRALQMLAGRLVIDWGKGAIKWNLSGRTAAKRAVVEISDPEAVAFPGFDRVLLRYTDLKEVVADRRYAAWQTALGSVQGIYLIADDVDGQLYVGKADGQDRILGRWTAYARDGHGGNKALRELAGLSAKHSDNFFFSILRVFGPSTPAAEVDEAEAHFKQALLTRKHGHNCN